MKDIADLLGRIFLAIISIYEALDTVFFRHNTLETMTNYGINQFQHTLLYGGVAVLLIGSILVMIGYYARVGASLLILYWLPVTLILYSFWNDAPDIQGVNATNFMHNLAMIGGLLVIVAHGAGAYSVKRLIYVMRLPK